MEQADVESFMTGIDVNSPIDSAFIDTLRDKISKIKVRDDAVKDFAKEEKVRKKKGLELFC
jgi:hypothetical protein